MIDLLKWPGILFLFGGAVIILEMRAGKDDAWKTSLEATQIIPRPKTKHPNFFRRATIRKSRGSGSMEFRFVSWLDPLSRPTPSRCQSRLI